MFYYISRSNFSPAAPSEDNTSQLHSLDIDVGDSAENSSSWTSASQREELMRSSTLSTSARDGRSSQRRAVEKSVEDRILDIIQESVANQVPQQNDEMYHFSLSLVPILNRLDSRKKREAKVRLLMVLDELEHDTPRPSPHPSTSSTWTSQQHTLQPEPDSSPAGRPSTPNEPVTSFLH